MSEKAAKIYWLIWSIEHDAWWKAGGRGYTDSIKEAGRFTYHKAREIVASGNYGKYDRPNEAMVPDYIGIDEDYQLTNNGAPHVCGEIAAFKGPRGKADSITLCARCKMPVDNK